WWSPCVSAAAWVLPACLKWRNVYCPIYGREAMLTYRPNIVLSTQEYDIVGKRPIRPDGAEKVTGHANYGSDIRLPGMLHGKILRSPYAHARIKSIDTRHAMELPGVYVVITSADLAQPSG